MIEIKGFENYLIDESGTIINKNTSCIKIGTSNNTGKGYLYVDLYKNGKRKRFYIHRLVAETFIPNPENKPYINHIDGNKLNNCVENLEWVDRSENIMHRIYSLKLGRKTPVRCVETGKIYQSQMEAERETGAENISGCCTGRYKTSGGYHWEEITEGNV